MEAKTNEEFFNVSALIDERLVRKEQLLVQRQKKRPTPFIQDRLSRTQEKRLKSLRLN